MNAKKHIPAEQQLRPTIDEVKPLAPELADAEQMKFFVRPIALDFDELAQLLNSAQCPAMAFEAWQFLQGRLFLFETGKSAFRN